MLDKGLTLCNAMCMGGNPPSHPIKSMTVYSLVCKVCAKPFEGRSSRTSTCSDRCKAEKVAEDKKKKIAYDRDRYLSNPEAAVKRSRVWKTNNREKVNAAARARWATPEGRAVMSARIDRYVTSHAEECKARWEANTRRRIETGEHQALCGKRRRRVEVNTPQMNDAEKAKLAQFYRVARLLSKRYGVAFDVDHVIPLSKGGAHHPSNLQILTASANRSKGAKLVA